MHAEVRDGARVFWPERTGREVGVDSRVALDPSGSLCDLRRFSHEAMATVYEVYASHADQRYAAQAAQAAFDMIDRLERELSRFLPNSDITRVNRLAPGERTRVSPATMECLSIARHMFELTGGAFDVSMGSGLRLLELDPDESLVMARAAGVRLDLGGIGKGYAVDLVAELLEEWGLSAALVHGGFSSVLALDAPPGHDGWPLTLSDPGVPSRELARLTVRQTALGASGVRKGDHILDPRTGTPVCGRIGAWASVRRPREHVQQIGSEPQPRAAAGAVADALATAFMLLSDEYIEQLCERCPGLDAWIVEDATAGNVDDRVRHYGEFIGRGARRPRPSA